MLQQVLSFLASNKVIIVGATVTVTESLTIIINFWRKIRADEKRTELMGTKPDSIGRTILWSANPLNLFRKP